MSHRRCALLTYVTQRNSGRTAELSINMSEWTLATRLSQLVISYSLSTCCSLSTSHPARTLNLSSLQPRFPSSAAGPVSPRQRSLGSSRSSAPLLSASLLFPLSFPLSLPTSPPPSCPLMAWSILLAVFSLDPSLSYPQ